MLFFVVACLTVADASSWLMQGMTYTGDRYCPQVPMGSALANLSLSQLATTGANWVAIVVTQYQQNISSKTIFPIYDPQSGNSLLFVIWCLLFIVLYALLDFPFKTDVECNYYVFVTTPMSGVRAAIQQAHALGLRVMLKPHIDLLENHL
jgi:hypothetical protein